jgi:hypothetical protein
MIPGFDYGKPVSKLLGIPEIAANLPPQTLVGFKCGQNLGDDVLAIGVPQRLVVPIPPIVLDLPVVPGLQVIHEDLMPVV